MLAGDAEIASAGRRRRCSRRCVAQHFARIGAHASSSRSVPNRVRGAWPRKMFSATERSSNSTVSWWIAVMPASKAACALGKLTGCAVERDLAGVRLVDAGQDLDQRRLAGAVLADQRGDLAGIEREADIVQRAHAGEALRDAGKREARLARPARRRAAMAARDGHASWSAASTGDWIKAFRKVRGGTMTPPDDARKARRLRRSSRTARCSTCRRRRAAAIAAELVSSSVTSPTRPIDSFAPGLASILLHGDVVRSGRRRSSRGRSGSRSRRPATTPLSMNFLNSEGSARPVTLTLPISPASVDDLRGRNDADGGRRDDRLEVRVGLQQALGLVGSTWPKSSSP